MKRMIFVGFAVMIIVLAATPGVFAGKGMGPGGGGGGTCINCSGPILDCSGVTQTVTGAVVSYAMPGLVVNTGTADEVFYGIGPLWYWESYGMDRPEIGEGVTLVTEAATIGSTTKQVIVSITVGDQTIDLRDAATCLPLWRGQR